jgi:hypothetical protein
MSDFVNRDLYILRVQKTHLHRAGHLLAVRSCDEGAQVVVWHVRLAADTGTAEHENKVGLACQAGSKHRQEQAGTAVHKYTVLNIELAADTR